MAVNIVMPALEMAQDSGKLLAWRKKEGESVTKGEPLLDVETDKAVVEIESPEDGILVGVKAGEGAVIPVGQTIAWIVKPGEAIPAEVNASASAAPTAVEAVRSSSAPLSVLVPEAPSRRISPKARRIAREHGIDISKVHGSGPEGAVLAEDVIAAVAASGEQRAPINSSVQPAQPNGDVEALTAVGRLMAERTTQSWTRVPHFFMVREVDAGALVRAREKLGPAIEGQYRVRLTHSDLLIALVARAVGRHLYLNASWTGEGIRHHREVNVSIAMAVEHGVVAPVLCNAAGTRLGEIALKRSQLSERAKAGRLRPDDLVGGTFTISNLGMYDVDAFSAIINPPQAAILAVGRIAERVVPVKGQPSVRPTMSITLSCDHRVVDGARAAAFLKDLAEAIADPEKWLE